MVDPLLSPWVILIPSVVVGAFLGVLFERTRGAAAKRAARLEAELVEARAKLVRYREQTKQHFGKSAELLGKMATNYRDFLDHFVSGAEELCGPNMKEINASGIDRRMLGTNAPTTAVGAPADGPTFAPAANGTIATPMPPPPARGTLASEPLAEDVAK